jgi:EAL domain-containing protein (putative c-di-GMP-specific phosphodiesterase class I)
VLGLDVVAEGIETANERDVAAVIGCAYGQGYLFSRPLAADDARRWLTGGRGASTADVVS